MSSIQDRLNAMKQGTKTASAQNTGGTARRIERGSIEDRLAKAREDSKNINGWGGTTATPAAEKFQRETDQWVSDGGGRRSTAVVEAPSSPAEDYTVFERMWDILSGAGKGTVSDFTNLGGTVTEGLGRIGSSLQDKKEARLVAQDQAYLEQARRDLAAAQASGNAQAAKNAQIRINQAEYRLKNAGVLNDLYDEVNREAAQKIYTKADALRASSQQDIDEAKEGLGGVGQFLVDTGVAGAQLAGDMGLAMLSGGSTLVPMAARVFGGSAGEARQSGADFGEQLAYGAGSALVSGLTERLSNVSGVFKSAFGSGVLDKALGKVAAKPMGKLVASALSEGAEEMLEAVAQPMLQRLTYDPDAAYDEDWLAEMLYSGAIGAVLGGAGAAISPSTYISGGNDVAVDHSAPAELAQAARETTTEGNSMGQAENAAEGLKMASEGIDAEQTLPSPAEQSAYNAGKAGVRRSDVELVTEAQEQAFEAGQRDRIMSASDADLAVENRRDEAYTGINKMEGTNYGTEEVHLRDGSQRIGSANPGGEVSAVEGSTGRDQSWQTQSVAADRGAASLAYGKAVSTSSLGIAGGSQVENIRIVTGGDTEFTRKAKAVAKQRGLRLVLFTGSNLEIRQKDGSVASVRAYISGDRVFVRADHPVFTSDQLMRHEAGHDMIAKGEVDLNAVRDRIESIHGKEKVGQLAQMYVDAYEGTGLTPDEIWEEAVCDSLGDMNIFAKTASEQAAHEMLTETKKAATETETEKTRGPPAEGKASRDLELRGEKKDKPQSAAEWSAFNRSFANKTSDMKPGDTRAISIITGSHVYWVTADGYMQGFAEMKIPISQTQKARLAARKERINGTNTDRGVLDRWAETVRSSGRGSGSDFSESSDRRTAGHDDGLSGSESDGKRAGYSERDHQDSERDNLIGEEKPIAGAIEFDGQDSYRVDESGAKRKFSMETPAEQTKTLIALHNMHEAKLRSTLELGAWPSPSVAIVEAEQGHTDYGEYSAVFPRSTIDPEADSRNKVYGSDAWTPTGNNARVDYEVDYNVKRNFNRKVEDLAKNVAGGVFARSSLLDMMGVENETNMTLREIAHKMATNYDSVRAAYLAEQGRDVDIVYRKKEFDSFGNDALRSYIDKLGEQEVARLSVKMLTGERLSAAEIAAAKDSIIESWATKNEWRLKQKPELRETRIAKQREKLTDLRAEDFVRHAWDFYEDSGATTDEINSMATSDNLRMAVDDKAVEEWVLSQLDGLLGEPGIYNNSEIFDARGNRKNFGETHWPYTVENIVKAMNAASARGEGMMGPAGATGLVAKATPEYRSVNEIRADKGRLGKVDEAEYKRLIQELDADLDAVVATVMRTTEHHTDNQYEEESIVQYVIGEAATGKKTIDAIVKQFKAEGYKISNTTATQIQDLFRKAAKIPTGYFEAKPQRVVGFDEAVALLAPSDAPADLIAEMKDKGINVISYEAGNNQERIDILNSLDGVRFSRELDSVNALREQNEALQEKVDYWKGQTKRTTQPTLRKGDVEKLAKNIIKKYDGVLEASEISGELKDLGEFILRGGEPDADLWAGIKDRSMNIARQIVNSAQVLTNEEALQDYKKIKAYLRNHPLAFDDKSDIADFNDFRKRNMGRFIISKDGTPVDSEWAKLQELFGESYFPSTIDHPAAQLQHIADLFDNMEPIFENPYSFRMAEATEYVANDIVDSLFSDELRLTPPTFADRQAEKLDKQKTKDKERLERLRQQKNDRIAEIRKEGQKRTREAVKAIRADRDAKIAEMKKNFQEKASKDRENRKAKELRERIQRHANDLSQKLINGSDKKHIPQELQGTVAKLLECINLESNYTYDPQTRTYKKDDAGLPTRRTKAFAALKREYEKLANELTIDPDLMGEDGLLSDVIDLADKRLVDMNSTELETVWMAVRSIEMTVLNANRAFSDARWETISDAAEALRQDNIGKALKTEYNGGLGKAQQLTGLDMMTPEAYLHRLGNTGDAMFRIMRDAQDEHIRMMKAVSDFTHENLKDVDVNKLEKAMHTVTLGGEEVKLSTAQLMELHVLMRRQQAQEHIMLGGILPDVVSNKGIKKISRAEPVRGVTLEEINKALSLLSADEVAVAEKLQEFASTTLSDYGNQASLKVYNYEKFNEKNYWPIRSNRQEIRSDVQKDTAVTSVANRGFTKGTKPHANTSVRLGSIFDTFSTHSSEMATYAAWLGASEDINRIRNYTFRNEQGERTGTVKGIIERVHGSRGTDYLQKLLADIANGIKGTHGETQFMSSLVGNYKAASVGANLRVVIQQPTAILRALDMLDPQYLVAGLKPAGGWKKAMKYAPIAQWKDWGYFDINTGRQMKDVLFDSDSAVNKVKNAGMWGAGKMDSLSWGLLWNAVETEVKVKQKNLKPGTKDFYDAVAKRFTEIVDHTQVVDGILQRSQIMRSSDGLTKMATSFMGEPTKQYNMLLSAAYDAKHSPKAGRKAAKARLARAAVTLAISGVANAMMQSLMDAVRDDDKEKEYWEKWRNHLFGFTGEEEGVKDHVDAFFAGNLGSTVNPAAYIPYVKDVLSILQGYDVSRMDMESVEKTITASQNMIKALSGDGKYTIGGASANLFAEVARLVGIPVANLKREIKSFAMLYAIESDNYLMQYRMEKASLDLNYSSNSTTFLDILYNAYTNDQAAYKLIYADMVKGGYDEEKIQNGMESRMKKAQGVKKAEELEQRYLSPSLQTSYDKTMKSVQSSSVWRGATAAQRDHLEDNLYDLVTGNSDGKKMQEKIDEGKLHGISETEYLLYKLALEMADKPSKSGKYGSYTNDEVEAAIESLGLSDKESSYLWLAQGKNEKSNPWG